MFLRINLALGTHLFPELLFSHVLVAAHAAIIAPFLSTANPDMAALAIMTLIGQGGHFSIIVDFFHGRRRQFFEAGGVLIGIQGDLIFHVRLVFRGP